MTHALPHSYTCFDGYRRIASGPLHTATLALKHAIEGGAAGPNLIFDDNTGRSIDVDMRGNDAEVLARLNNMVAGAASARAHFSPQDACDSVNSVIPVDEPRSRGRPKLGVMPREVTLLPRHWDWLSSQPGGASVALRKLVEEARRAHGDKDKIRSMQERAYHFMSAMAGDMSNFEEATRALFANDQITFSALIAVWPVDVRDHVTWLASDKEASAR